MFKLISARSFAVTVLSFVAVSLAIMWPTWRNELMAFGYADVYRLAGQAATCYYFTYDSGDDGSYSYRDIEIQVGQGEINTPPHNTQQIVLASVDIWEGECDSEENCYYNVYDSGEITLPAEAVTFGKRLTSASVKTTIDVYSWADPETPIPVDIDLAWVPTGQRPDRQSQVYHRTTPWEIVRERVQETARAAFVNGTIGFQGVTYSIGPDSDSFGYLISDRAGQVYIIRAH